MDKKIKKRSGWSLYSKPYCPSKPIEPQKEYTYTKFKEIYKTNSSQIKLSEIAIPLKYTADNVIIKSVHGHECDDNLLEVGVNEETTEETPNYKAALKYYKTSLEKYNVAKEAYKEELREWEIWCKQENERQLQRRLKQAEKLLRKHGKLKENSNG